VKLKSDLWSLLNNPQKVSVNLLSDEDVDEPEVEGRKLLRIRVPRAHRRERPVFLNANPLTGTYRRNNDGDYRCPQDVVKRLLAEQVEDSRDAKLLDGFSTDDLDPATFAAYRQTFASTKPTHPWIQLPDPEFLRSVGAWTVDRDTGKEGLTIAGLLMFGSLRSILEGVPNYIVDYQEWLAPDGGGRWVDRVTTDGSWSGNLYDFYRMVIVRLGRDLPTRRCTRRCARPW
jgi:ATP-dependent DNA helicase RecG